MNRTAIRRVLVIRRKALGDALVTLPAVLALAERLPGARIDLVIDRPFAPLLAELASDLRVIAWPPDGGGRGWIDRLRAGRYDLVIDYLGSPRTAWWTVLSGAPRRVGYDLPGRRWAYNVRVPRNDLGGIALRSFAGEAFLDPLRSLGLAPAPWRAADAATPCPRAGLGTDYLDWVRDWERSPAPRAALVFSATWPAKAWPASHAARLWERLEQIGVAGVFVPGPQDAALVAALRAVAPSAGFAPATNLLELADLLRRCQICIATDNGTRHLAAALAVPTVTVFGPTDPRGWNPPDRRHVAVTNPVACAPCDLTACPVAGHPCLDGLLPEAVLAAVRRVLGI